MGTWCPQELQIELYPFVMLRNIYPLWTNNNFRDVIPRYVWSQKKNSGPENLGESIHLFPQRPWSPGSLGERSGDFSSLPRFGLTSTRRSDRLSRSCWKWSVVKHLGKRFGIFVGCEVFVFLWKVWWTLVKMEEHGKCLFQVLFFRTEVNVMCKMFGS